MNPPESISIGRRSVGGGSPAFIIAELSANHHGSLESALELVRLAKEAGADAVKIQTYTPDTLTIDCDNAHFRIGAGTIWEGKNLHALYGEAYTPWEWHGAIFERAAELGLPCFSTPFDESAVDFLEQFDPPAYKIASFELVHHPLLAKVALTGRPVIMSTGMASLAEIAEAVDVLRGAGCRELALLKCTSAYPAPPEEANLARIRHMAEAFGCPCGLSDHTMGGVVPAVAVALGACIVEKHFTDSREIPGPDSAFSLEPDEFRAMVESVRTAEKSVGAVDYSLTGKEEASRVFRRSIFVVRDIAEGEAFSAENLRIIRPGYGLAPRELPQIIGRRAAKSIPRGTPMSWDLVAR